MAERISEAMVEIGARASATKHYAERFRASPDNPQVQVNADANWYLFADEARTVLTAVLSASPASAQMEGWQKIERELRDNLASFDAEVAYELENEGERADLWTDIDVPVEAIRALLDELSRLREALDQAIALAELRQRMLIEANTELEGYRADFLLGGCNG